MENVCLAAFSKKKTFQSGDVFLGKNCFYKNNISIIKKCKSSDEHGLFSLIFNYSHITFLSQFIFQ
jgi:hypothetical protein